MSRNPKWIAGVIIKVTGPLSYVIRLSSDHTVRRHVDNIRRRESATPDNGLTAPSSDQNPAMVVDGSESTMESITSQGSSEPDAPDHVASNSPEPQLPPESVSGTDTEPTVRRSNRPHNPPVRYGH